MAKRGFPGGRPMGGGGMNNMLRQAQKMQEDMLKAQEETAAKTVEVSVGGGAVKVVASGAKEIVEIKILPDVVDKDDVEMLEDLVLSAVNEALSKADALAKETMSRITGSMNIPGLF